jgi:hypothetical protein
MKQKRMFLVPVIMMMLTIFSCPNQGTEDPANQSEGKGSDDPAYITHFVKDASGNVQFFTNDPDKLNKTLWNIGNLSQSTDTYFVDIEVKKVSGNKDTGYGIILCADPVVGQNYVMVQIALSGQYMIGKVTNKITQTPLIKDWSVCTAIKKNYNDINRIKVRYNNDPAVLKFELFINDDGDDSPVCSFIDNTAPAYVSGRWGFIAQVSAMDDVANVPVEIWYRDFTP